MFPNIAPIDLMQRVEDAIYWSPEKFYILLVFIQDDGTPNAIYLGTKFNPRDLDLYYQSISAS